MSTYAAQRVTTDLNNRPAFLGPQAFAEIGDPGGADRALGLTAIRMLALADPEKEIAANGRRWLELSSAYGFGTPMERPEKPYLLVDGAAIIPIHGMLINRFPYSWSWITGYNFIRDQVNAARIDPDVKLIVFDVNSCGGTVAGCQETADVIFEARQDKPSLAVVDAGCYSAAYYLASQASKVVVTPSGGVGSIGVMCLRFDFSKAMEQYGTKVTMIHAGKFKTDGMPFAAMSADEEARIQASVDESYDSFVSAVVRGRGLADQAVRDTEAGTYNAPEAMRIGLVDGITAPAAAVRDALCPPDDDENDDPEDDPSMTTPAVAAAAAAAPAAPTTEQLAQAATDARTAERARINSILTCDEAKGKDTLANHIATATGLSVDEAKVMLAAAASEKVAEAAPGNPLERAMDRAGTPGVGDGGGAPTGEDAKVAQILAAQKRAGGHEIVKAA